MDSFVLKLYDKRRDKIRTVLVHKRMALSNILRQLDEKYKILNISIYNELEHNYELLEDLKFDLKPKNLELGTHQESTDYEKE